MRARKLAVTLTVALAAVACSPDAGDTSTTTTIVDTTTTQAPTTTTTIPVEACDPDGVVIDLRVLERSEPAANAGKAALEAEYEGLTVEVNVLTTGSYPELAQQAIADIAVDRGPDVIETGLGLVTFVTDGLAARPIDPSFLSETYETRFLEAGRVDGQIRVVPWQVSAPLWFYNKDLYEQAGLDPEAPPTSYAEVLEHARALAEVLDAESIHMPATLVGDWFFQNAVQAGGGTLIGPDGLPAFDTVEGRNGLALWNDAALEGLHIDIPALQALGLFVQGELGLFAGSSSVLANVTGGIGDAFEWGTFIHPVIDGVDPSWAIGGAGFSVLSEDECEAAFATELIREILNPEVIASIVMSTGYYPVDTAAMPLLEEFFGDNPQWNFAPGFDVPLVPWAGWRGERALEVNLVLQDAMLRLTKGEDLETVVSETAEEVATLVGD